MKDSELNKSDIANIVRAKLVSEMLEMARGSGGEIGSKEFLGILKRVFVEGEIKLRISRLSERRERYLGREELLEYLFVLAENDVLELMEDLCGDDLEVGVEDSGVIIDSKI
jgi:hypothetical protein